MTSRKGKYMRIFAVIAVLALAVSLTALVACVDPKDPDPGTGTTYKIIFDAGENMQDPKDIVLSGSSQIILPSFLLFLTILYAKASSLSRFVTSCRFISTPSGFKAAV